MFKIFFVLLFSFAYLFSNQNQLNLTKEEVNYLVINKKIKVHNERDYAPINFYKNGEAKGYSIDFIKLLASKVGLEVEFVTGEWNELLNQAMNNKIDVMMNIAYTKNRAKNLNYVDSYLENPLVIIGRKNDNFTDLNSLKGKKVAVVEGFSDEALLLEKYPYIQKVTYKNSIDAFKAVEYNQADATFETSIISKYIINDHILSSLALKNEINTGNIEDNKLFIATKKDGKILASILKKAMNIITPTEIDEIKNKWLLNPQNSSINLTSTQLKWLKDHSPIKLGSTNNWEPFDMIENGKHTGINADFIEQLRKILNIDIEPILVNTWNDVLKDAKDAKTHGITALSIAPEYEKDFLFTQSYINNPVVIFTKTNNKIKNIKELKKLVTTVGNDFSKELSKTQLSNIKYLNSVQDCLNDVLSGNSEGYIGWLDDAQYIINKNSIMGLAPTIYLQSEQSELRIGISKQYPELKEILDVAISQITQEERRKILNKWIDSSIKINQKVDLTTEEIKWLKINQNIRFSIDPEWAPIEFITENGKYEGLNADYLKLISEMSGIKFSLVPTNNWAESVKLSEDNKIDMLACVSKTAKREGYLNFSNKTIELTDGIVVRNDNKTIKNLDDLKNYIVGVPEGTALESKLKSEYPNNTYIGIKGSKKALEMLSNGELDAYVGNLEVTGYFLQKLGLHNLRFVYKLPESRFMHIAIQKSFAPEALSIINKVIDKISENDIQIMRQRWVGLSVNENLDYFLFLKIALGVILLIVIIIFYNIKLKHMVKEKTSELSSLLENFDKNVIASRTDLNGKIIYVSDAFCKISGYTKSELLGKSHNIVRHPDMPKEIYIQLWQTIKNNNIWKGEIKNKKKDGGFYWTQAIISPEYDSSGKIVSFSAVRHDITAKKEVEELTFTLEEKVKIRTIDLENEKKFVNSVMNSQSSIVIATDGLTLKIANRSFLNFYSVSDIHEFKEKFGNCICDTFVVSDNDEYLQKITKGKKWIDYVYDNQDLLHKVKIRKADKEHIFSITVDKFEFNGEILLTAVFSDITQLEEAKIQTLNAYSFMSQLINSIPNPIFYKNEFGQFIGFNRAYERVFAIESKELLGKTVMDLDYIPFDDRKKYNEEDMNIINTIGSLEREQNMVFADNKIHNTIYSVSSFTKNDGTSAGLIGIFTDITAQKEMEKEVLSMHKQTRDSIEYAAFIQHSLIPSNDLFRNYFSDYLTIWHPKDIVGGDIYLLEKLSKDECLLMIIDCTGHGVPGAFVTMLVKAIERQIIGYILNNPNEEISPAKILSIFNKSIKHLLKQEEENSISNVGFDGGILYYNKKENIIKYSGANTSLIILKDDELKTIKGNKHSVGYKKSDKDFIFTDHEVCVEKEMSFFITTDGYLDQNGGDKGFPFGRKRFENLLLEYKNESFADIQEILLDSLARHQGDEIRNDDVTVIGFKI